MGPPSTAVGIVEIEEQGQPSAALRDPAAKTHNGIEKMKQIVGTVEMEGMVGMVRMERHRTAPG